MYTIKGRATNALVTNENIDQNAIDQLQTIIGQPMAQNTQVALMPDGHFGADVPVGMTMRMLSASNQWRIAPSIISGDIGCGMLTVQIKDQNLDLAKLDQVINQYIPSGFDKNTNSNSLIMEHNLACELSFNTNQNNPNDLKVSSLGTLGGGNHFIEVNQDQHGHYWLVIHCGSRHFGVDILKHHFKVAQIQTRKRAIKAIVDQYQKQNRQQKIANAIAEYKQTHPATKDPYAFLTNDQMVDYLNDVYLGQKFAQINRNLIAETILNQMRWQEISRFESVHNYFNLEDQTIRKGATAAHRGQKLLIPLNMRDGSLICIGKGNADWNFSAPHGAGRLLSRSQANTQLNLDQFKSEMHGIYTSSVNANTLDEAPEAYKPMQQIIDHIQPTVEIVERIKPVYNFKAH